MSAKANIHCLAFDLGAESGRAMLGRFDGERVSLAEVHRFPNGPVRVHDALHWDALRLFSEIKHGLSRAAQRGEEIVSVGVDTWGVDFALLDEAGQLIGNPYHYRDPRTDGMLEETLRRAPREEIFAQTGIQFLPLNTLIQLVAMQARQAHALRAAATLLMMPDLFTYWLAGTRVSEFTNATTTQCYNPREGRWATELLQRLDLPTGIWPEITPPGTRLGPLLPSVREETGLPPIDVVATASHDTAAAVAATPLSGPEAAYISSGTWSLMGVETDRPIITPHSLAFNFTNEGGVGGAFRVLKNIMGLWLVQECRRVWANAGASFSYDELTQLAAAAPPLDSLVDPDNPRFLRPVDMPAALRQVCIDSGQMPPASRGETIRCALESLALKYRRTLEQVETLLGHGVETIHIVGGGSQNRLLCQWTADATGRLVIAGPVEATALGNVLVQLMARGEIGSLAEGRELVRRSATLITYEPQRTPAWDEAYARFVRLLPS